jgi:predicted RNA-binding Zn-ribbon protein involved in translation (DUF1610 family)
MQCPNCGSIHVRRSSRRGLREGLFLRILFRAPYRCLECGTRFFGTSLDPVFRSRRKHRSLAAYLGLREGQIRRFRWALFIIILFVVLVFLAIRLVHYLSEPSAPSPIP